MKRVFNYQMRFSYKEFYEKIEGMGHKLFRDENGEVDCWILDYDYHNGPGCEKCEDSWCHHCQGEISRCEGEEKMMSMAEMAVYGASKNEKD